MKKLKESINKKITVIGAGSWGTAIALLLARNGETVTLWCHNPTHAKQIHRERENRKYLKGYVLPETIYITSEMEYAVKDCDILCMVVPSHGFRDIYQKCTTWLSQKSTVISAVKGIENETLMTMSQVIYDVDYNCSSGKLLRNIAVLSGPSFAKEVAAEIPTAVTIGCSDLQTAKALQQLFGNEKFRVYTSIDVIGLEISAAMKNVIAIAAGICESLGYGLNTRAALITRGLAEISRLGMAMRTDPVTFSGLSGMGDLVLTCTGDLSRNRKVGIKLGQGKSLDEVLDEMEMVAEGIKTTRSAYQLAKKMEVDMPILEQVYQIIYAGKVPLDAVEDLLNREMKDE